MSETVLQFGAGRFLRGFIDRFISQLNRTEHAIGKIAVVQSTTGGRASLLNQFQGHFPVVVRGVENGQVVETVTAVDSISRALVAENQWQEILQIAQQPELAWIVTNATEAGYCLSQTPFHKDQAPSTMPGKLTAVLYARYQADLPPLSILPCELIARNADKLCDLVGAQADAWDLPAGFRHYATDQCYWLNNLVDCMISDLPDDDPRRIDNPLAIMAEPYALLAIEQPLQTVFPLANHSAVKIVEQLEPYYLSKVRVLNGIHSAMVAKYYGSRLETVQQIMADKEGLRWVRDLLYGEILPTLLSRVDEGVAFADATLDRFCNPYMAHRLRDIRLNHEQKVPVRLIPTADEYQRLFGCPAKLLQAAIQTNVGQ